MRVGFYPRKNPTTHGSYLITLFDENFVIPKHIAEYWRLQSGSVVNVQWQVLDDIHPHAYAQMARKSDDGRRVGIRVFKTVGQIPCEHWIVRNTVQAVCNSKYPSRLSYWSNCWQRLQMEELSKVYLSKERTLYKS
jgi:hypothetical protein